MCIELNTTKGQMCIEINITEGQLCIEINITEGQMCIEINSWQRTQIWNNGEDRRERESDIKRMKKRKKTGTTREKDTVCEAEKHSDGKMRERER